MLARSSERAPTARPRRVTAMETEECPEWNDDFAPCSFPFTPESNCTQTFAQAAGHEYDTARAVYLALESLALAGLVTRAAQILVDSRKVRAPPCVLRLLGDFERRNKDLYELDHLFFVALVMNGCLLAQSSDLFAWGDRVPYHAYYAVRDVMLFCAYMLILLSVSYWCRVSYIIANPLSRFGLERKEPLRINKVLFRSCSAFYAAAYLSLTPWAIFGNEGNAGSVKTTPNLLKGVVTSFLGMAMCAAGAYYVFRLFRGLKDADVNEQTLSTGSPASVRQIQRRLQKRKRQTRKTAMQLFALASLMTIAFAWTVQTTIVEFERGDEATFVQPPCDGDTAGKTLHDLPTLLCLLGLFLLLWLVPPRSVANVRAGDASSDVPSSTSGAHSDAGGSAASLTFVESPLRAKGKLSGQQQAAAAEALTTVSEAEPDA